MVEARVNLNEGEARNTCSGTRLEKSADEGAPITRTLLSKPPIHTTVLNEPADLQLTVNNGSRLIRPEMRMVEQQVCACR